MTPHDLRGAVIQQRLALMNLLIEDLDRFGEVTAGRLTEDRYVRHVVEHVLEQLVQLAVGINSHVAAAVLGQAVTDYRASFDVAARAGLISRELATRLQPSTGLRNVVVHEYLDVDLAVLAGAVPAARQDYAAYIRSVADWLADKGSSSG